MPVVSVIVPTCDRPELLGRALGSILATTVADCEVLVVDNNRRSAPVRAQPGLAQLLGDPRVRVLSGGGAATAGAARNVGLRAAAGEWVTFLDDDDEYAPGKVDRQLALARESGQPMVLCGYEVQLGPRIRRIQTDARQFTGDALLLEAIWGTPFLFHQRTPGHRFDETLEAAEDLDYAQRLLARYGQRTVPNVPAPLVRVHLQAHRTNTRHEAHWRASRRVLAGQPGRYSRAARRVFLLRARLQRHKGPGGSWAALLRAGTALVRTAGVAELRRVTNAWLFRTGCFNRWLVS